MSLWQSRKFRALVLDVAFSTAIYFVTKYIAPDIGEDVLWLIGSYQPIFFAVIVGTAYEDGQAKKAGQFKVPKK